ncbi:hypothetical protein K493DRAFT_308176 [Basidiobolus meristosporus CBS 931.73]|uniref:Uncharacterized protein n=1 Tax=Basidiobolus meristosporus CBS 931.73 TaxID=1314790 RepID=A0A1Y1X5M0_9FUNG|nr:hypothetical protein K493DRAFT_308176 [Basidiobolus meristosporus CBS 931.73]|eukprot:ORX81107.1 hypothetical protein K493DRAFT_308176 [Basidiobolus meristosporus CBS 931.73]
MKAHASQGSWILGTILYPCFGLSSGIKPHHNGAFTRAQFVMVMLLSLSTGLPACNPTPETSWIQGQNQLDVANHCCTLDQIGLSLNEAGMGLDQVNSRAEVLAVALMETGYLSDSCILYQWLCIILIPSSNSHPRNVIVVPGKDRMMYASFQRLSRTRMLDLQPRANIAGYLRATGSGPRSDEFSITRLHRYIQTSYLGFSTHAS